MGTSIKMESQTMCTGCPGHCCKINAEVTAFDIARIAILEKMEIIDFVHASESSDEYGFKALGSKYSFILMHKNNACIFYNKKNGIGCSIEDSKPSVCLAYPFSITQGIPVLRDDVLCPPMNFKLADWEKMSKKIIEDYFWEWEQYLLIMDNWNSFSKGTEKPHEFLEHALWSIERRKSPFGQLHYHAHILFKKYF
ncbi:YkgJ family cysteine cluster protein [Candidatus Micrarchaeota archaeon]|nr:YkgJ family cysteine cluster protein [Candidatus Micrarchaeota archaeon]